MLDLLHHKHMPQYMRPDLHCVRGDLGVAAMGMGSRGDSLYEDGASSLLHRRGMRSFARGRARREARGKEELRKANA